MSKVALTRGDSRRKNIFESLKLIEKEIREKVEGKRVLIKPNFTSSSIRKAATHIDQIRGILDFLSEVYEGKITIAEGSGQNTFEGYRNFGYLKLKDEYQLPIEFIDLNKDDFEMIPISKSVSVRVSKTILDPSFFVISAAKLKTHDAVIATLSIKNLAMGMVLSRDKGKVHQGIEEINHNLFLLAKKRMPDLSSIDGFYGMEGEGPIGGNMLRCAVAIASTDSLAADRVGLEIMGIDPEDVGYLVYCGRSNLGEYDLGKISVVGTELEECKNEKEFRLHSTIKRQLLWKVG
jgi:uncharacterized protein (DUF362 family)